MEGEEKALGSESEAGGMDEFYSSSSPSQTPSPPLPPESSGGVFINEAIQGAKENMISEELAAGSSSLPLFSPMITTVSSSQYLETTSSSSHKRSRGRPRGSGKRQLLATLGEWFAYTAGGNFTPHVVTVAAGEDVATRIMSFSKKGPRGICILSANGAVSNVTLRQPGLSGGTFTFEGRFEILSLTGSFSITEDDGVRSRTGGLSVSLAGPDGRVIGGGVAGLLLAASPIQVVVGSFLPNTLKEHERRLNNSRPPSFSPSTIGDVASEASKAMSCANPDSATPISTLPDKAEKSNSNLNPTPTPTPTPLPLAVGWQGLMQHSSSSEHKPSPDINLSLHPEH